MPKENDKIRDTLIAILLRLDHRLNVLECGECDGSPVLQAKEIMELADMMGVAGISAQIIQRSDMEYLISHGLGSRGPE